MPVMGPNYSKDDANRACEQLLNILIKQYGLYSLKSENVCGGYPAKSEKMNKIKAERLEEFTKAVHRLFEYESWDTF